MAIHALLNQDGFDSCKPEYNSRSKEAVHHGNEYLGYRGQSTGYWVVSTANGAKMQEEHTDPHLC